MWYTDNKDGPALVTKGELKDNQQLFPSLLRLERKWVYTGVGGI